MTEDDIRRWLATEVQPNQPLYDTLGVFTHKFGTGDLRLTRLHAHLEGCRNFEDFADKKKATAGVRVTKIRETAASGRQLGEVFSGRLDIYSEVVLLRNRLMHDEVTADADGIKLISLDRYEVHDGEGTVRPSARPQIKFRMVEISAVSFWLHTFADDVAELAEKIWDTDAAVEIDQYRSADRCPFDKSRLNP